MGTPGQQRPGQLYRKTRPATTSAVAEAARTLKPPNAARPSQGWFSLSAAGQRRESVGYNEAMRVWVLLVALLAGLLLQAQSPLTYKQLRDLIRSSLEQNHRDREIADFLKTQKLTFALEEKLIEEFVGMGVGPKTLEALEKLKADSQGMPEPETAEAVPPERRQPPPPSAEEQKRILGEARRGALEYTRDLPDYLCLQVTRRYVDPSGLEMDWLKYDEVKTRVSYVDQHENYELVSVNNKVTNKSLEDLGGAISTGEFGSILAEIFAPATDTEFHWARHALLRGRGVWVFSLRVPKSRSHWGLYYEKQQGITTGYTGLVYIDKETERVTRIVMQAQDVPSDFPIQDARTRLDYDFIEIAGGSYLLPLKARVFMRDGRYLSRNDVEFRLYRKFSAEASISFDEIDGLAPLPEDEPDGGEAGGKTAAPAEQPPGAK
jgi:hypothetical protein